MPEPTLRQLHYLVALAEDLHFGDAAARCNVSQPNMSAQIRELEKILGVQLFERAPRSILLTDHGREVVAKARMVLQGVDELMAVASQTSDPLSGRLRLGVIPTVAPYVLPRALPSVRKQYPLLELQLIEDFTERLLDRLEQGELDVALIALPVDRIGLMSATIAEEPFLVLASHGHELGSKKAIDPAHFEPADLLLLQEGHCLRDQALEVCQLRSTRRSPVEGSSLSTLVQMVANGLGTTLLPLMALTVDVGRSKELEVLRFRNPQPGRTLGLVWRESAVNQEAYEELASLIRDQSIDIINNANEVLKKRALRN